MCTRGTFIKFSLLHLWIENGILIILYVCFLVSVVVEAFIYSCKKVYQFESKLLFTPFYYISQVKELKRFLRSETLKRVGPSKGELREAARQQARQERDKQLRQQQQRDQAAADDTPDSTVDTTSEDETDTEHTSTNDTEDDAKRGIGDSEL